MVNTALKISQPQSHSPAFAEQKATANIFKVATTRWLALSGTWLLGLMLWSVCPLFSQLISPDTHNLLWNCLFVYSFFGLAWDLCFAKFFPKTYLQARSNSLELFKFLGRYINRFSKRTSEKVTKKYIYKREKLSVLFFAVRIFYLPLMLNTFVSHTTSLSLAQDWTSILVQTSNPNWLLQILYFLDVVPFALAYVLNFGNFRTRSVDTTFVGWFFCLLCYPPFNGSFGEIFPFNHSDYAGWWAWISLAFISVYVWASLALGLRSGHLQYRGLCDSGPYSFIRHPAYAFKTMSWWVGTISWTCMQISLSSNVKETFLVIAWNFVSAVAWTWVYHQRALSEERHLLKYAEYNNYCQRVKYRYIPFVV